MQNPIFNLVHTFNQGNNNNNTSLSQQNQFIPNSVNPSMMNMNMNINTFTDNNGQMMNPMNNPMMNPTTNPTMNPMNNMPMSVISQQMQNQYYRQLSNNTGTQNSSSNQNVQNEQLLTPNDNITVVFRTSNNINDYPLKIQCTKNEKVSDLIERYRTKAVDHDTTKRFIFNAKELNKDLTIEEAGLSEGSNIFVVTTAGYKNEIIRCRTNVNDKYGMNMGNMGNMNNGMNMGMNNMNMDMNNMNNMNAMNNGMNMNMNMNNMNNMNMMNCMQMNPMMKFNMMGNNMQGQNMASMAQSMMNNFSNFQPPIVQDNQAQNNNNSNFINLKFRVGGLQRQTQQDDSNAEIVIQCTLDEKLSVIVDRYKKKSGDDITDKNFVYNAKKLNLTSTAAEAGLINGSIILPLNTKNTKGA